MNVALPFEKGGVKSTRFVAVAIRTLSSFHRSAFKLFKLATIEVSSVTVTPGTYQPSEVGVSQSILNVISTRELSADSGVTVAAMGST